MHLGAQYYRAPFPESRYWEEDLRRMRDAGLNTVQLWLLWAWIEATPSQYVFDDYDRLLELTAHNGLGVVLSTIAEIQPYWIHREVPGSEMVNHLGHRVISQNRNECHFGLTPGGCTDHPGVWERMAAFFNSVVTRYRDLPNLRGWDCWNETRWNVDADGIVCYCPRLTGVKEIGRKQLTSNTVAVDLDGVKCELELTQWLTPLEHHHGTVHAGNQNGALLSSLPVGAGRVIYFAGYLGESYRAKPNTGFEDYVAWVVRKAGVQAEIDVLLPQPDSTSFLYVKHGMSLNRRVVFVFFQKDHHLAHLRFRKGFFASDSVRDLIAGDVHRLEPGFGDSTELKMNCPNWRFAVLVEEQ